jgi:LPXTG-site transpeptidase (sortase) family protein
MKHLIFESQRRRVLSACISIVIALGLMAPFQTVHMAFAQPALPPPQRLAIPAIDIDTAIESVGLTPNGDMDVPKDSKQVAWFNPGPVPGSPGNSAISGHYDDKQGPAVFYRLGKLRKGDKVIVTDANKVERVFTVMEVERYPYNKAPLARIFGMDFERDLNLITCAGAWNARTRNYSQRIVVYTRLDP